MKVIDRSKETFLTILLFLTPILLITYYLMIFFISFIFLNLPEKFITINGNVDYFIKKWEKPKSLKGFYYYEIYINHAKYYIRYENGKDLNISSFDDILKNKSNLELTIPDESNKIKEYYKSFIFQIKYKDDYLITIEQVSNNFRNNIMVELVKLFFIGLIILFIILFKYDEVYEFYYMVFVKNKWIYIAKFIFLILSLLLMPILFLIK